MNDEKLSKADKILITVGVVTAAVLSIGALKLYSKYIGDCLTVIGKQADTLTEHILATANQQ